MPMAQWGEPNVYRCHIQRGMLFLWDRAEREYGVALSSFISEHVDGRKRLSVAMSHGLMDAPHEGFSFLTRYRI